MKKLLKENRWLTVVILLEIVYLAVTGLTKLVTPPVNIDYSISDITFSYDSMELVTQEEDGSYTITSDNWALEADAWQISNISLPSGTYDVSIQYAADGVLSSFQDSRITIKNVLPDSYFNDEIVTLSNYSTEVKKTIYLGASGNRITVSAHYGGLGSLNIKGIRIQENKMARLGNWLHQLIMLLLLDLALILLFDRKAVSEDRRKMLFETACIVTFASLPMISDILKSGHDLYFHIGRIEGVANALAEGQFPVRVYQSAFNGYGYASPLFYGDIFLYFPAILHLLGFPLYRAYQYYIILMNLAACLITYKCCSNLFTNKRIGMICALLYTCSIYRLTCVYSRAAIGEFSAMTFFPLVVYGLWAVTGDKRKFGWLWLALGVSGILQTHTLSTEMAGLFCVLAAVILFKKLLRPKALLQLGKAAAAAIFLNLWFIVPFLQYVGGNYNVRNLSNETVSASGLYVGQIFSLFIEANSGINQLNSSADEMGLGIGISLVCCLLLFLKCCVWNEEKEKEAYQLGKLTLALSLAALWMTSIYFPWNRLAQIGKSVRDMAFMIQYPWRYLAIATVLLTVVGGCVLRILLAKEHLLEYQIVSGILVGTAVLGAGYYLSQYINVTKEVDYVDLHDSEIVLDTLYWYQGSDILYEDADPKYDDSVQMMDYQYEKGHTTFYCVNNGSEEQMILLPIAYYPDYYARDSANLEIAVEKSDNGQVGLVIPAGYEGNIDVYFRIPLLWRISEWVSLLTLITGVGWFLHGYFVRIRQKKSAPV